MKINEIVKEMKPLYHIILISACLLSAASSQYFAESTEDNHQEKNFPCPNAYEITPCVCLEEIKGLVLNCDSVTSDQQLSAVFQADFPVKDFYMLEIIGATGISTLGVDLTSVTFKNLIVANTPLLIVGEYFLRANADTLEVIDISNTDVNQDSFSFYDIQLLTKLVTLDLELNRFSFIIPLISDTLESLDLSNNDITSISPGTFNGTTVLQRLDLYDNDIPELLPNTFFVPPSMTDLSLSSTGIRTVHPGAIVLGENTNLLTLSLDYNAITQLLPGTIVIPSTLNYLRLNGNLINTIYPGAFVISKGTQLSYLVTYLSGNELTALDQEVFEPLFIRSSFVDLNYNPLTCGCDIAWLVTNTSLMAKVVDNDPMCADGTVVHTLDPSTYELYC